MDLLYLKRGNKANDRYAGNLVFPGGMMEPGETLLQTCVRETREETAIDLHEQNNYVYLGPYP